MNYQADPKLYDHVFSPSKWKLLLAALAFGVFGALVGYVSFSKFQKTGVVDWTIVFVVIGCFLFTALGIIGSFFASRSFSVGINKDGVFIRGYGLVPWNQIKGYGLGKMKTAYHCEKFIALSLHDPETFFAQLSRTQRINRLLSKDKVFIMGSAVSIKLEELLNLLQEYQRAVTQNR